MNKIWYLKAVFYLSDFIEKIYILMSIKTMIKKKTTEINENGGYKNVLSKYYDIFYVGIVLQMINTMCSILLKNGFWQDINMWYSQRVFSIYQKSYVFKKRDWMVPIRRTKSFSSNACGNSLTRTDTYFTNTWKKWSLIPTLCNTIYSYIIPPTYFWNQN